MIVDEVLIGTWIYCTHIDPRLQVIMVVSLIHTLYSSLEHTFESFQLALSSPVLWYRLPTADVGLPLGFLFVTGQLLTATAHNNRAPTLI